MVQHNKPTIFRKIRNFFAELVEKFDNNIKNSEAFRNGEYCDERKVFLKEIKIMKILLCVNMLCTLTLAWIMVR